MSIQIGIDGSFAREMLKEDGQQMYLRAPPGDETFDPSTGKVTAVDQPVDTPFLGAPSSITVDYAQSVSASLIKQGDLLVFAEPVREVSQNDKVVINTEIYTMVNFQPVIDAGIIKLYVFHIRK